MLLYPKESITHLALIVRNSYPGIHASQIAFPGGKVETYDADLSQTALRETHEEIGIPSTMISLVKAFSEVYIPPSNYLVSPFLGFSENELSFSLNPEEVSGIIELPMYEFLDDSLVVNVNMSTSYATDIIVPAFQINEHLVWGATAMMMSELKEIFKKVI
jgi:8-oxo-dGTP pyrophosphatase MutT (NUDIX family)